MNKELTELSRELVGLEGFVWGAGLKAGRLRIDGQDPDGRPVRYESYYDEWDEKDPYKKCACYAGDNTPDLTDPGTGGILLDALGPVWSAHHAPDGTWAVTDYGDTFHRGSTLAEACAQALVARGWYGRSHG